MKRKLALLLLGFAALALLVGGDAYMGYRRDPLVQVVNLPETYPRRGAWVSANVTGRLSPRAERCRYRVNEGAWKEIVQLPPRHHAPLFTLEIPPDALVAGDNRLELHAEAPFRPDERHELAFRYDPSPIELPLTVDWRQASLESQDGVWERVQIDGEWRVRPVPGTEGYDRILLVTGAFPGGRRVETDVVFRYPMTHPSGVGRWEQIVGMLPLWGGHVDSWDTSPRGGWSFAMACWWSKPGGAGAEISHRVAGEEPAWVNSYRNLALEPGVRYRVVSEVQPVRTAAGAHVGFRQRVLFWPASEPRPAQWIEVDDVEGAPLPDKDYAVALLLYRCQADFGAVRVEPLPDLIVDGEG